MACWAKYSIFTLGDFPPQAAPQAEARSDDSDEEKILAIPEYSTYCPP
jgi:hypothetical protein